MKKIERIEYDPIALDEWEYGDNIVFLWAPQDQDKLVDDVNQIISSIINEGIHCFWSEKIPDPSWNSEAVSYTHLTLPTKA